VERFVIRLLVICGSKYSKFKMDLRGYDVVFFGILGDFGRKGD
jgi:hypothetical protein